MMDSTLISNSCFLREFTMLTAIQHLIDHSTLYSDAAIIDYVQGCTSDELNELYTYGSSRVVNLIDIVTYRRI